MQIFQTISKLFFFLLHVVTTIVLINILAEQMSQPINIMLVLLLGFATTILVVLTLSHLVNLLNHFRNLKNKDQ